MGRAILIIIYADTGKDGGGFRGPIFPDNTFEGIPIPHKKNRGIRYQEIIGVHGRPLSDFIPPRRLKTFPFAHFDPNPVHLTYGDCYWSPRSKIANQIKNFLQPGDLLLWAARLEPHDGTVYLRQPPKIFLIGWMECALVVDFTNSTTLTPIECAITDNAHIHEADGNRMIMARRKDVVVYGRTGGQLQYAIPLTKEVHGEYPILTDKKKIFKNIITTLKMAGHYNLIYSEAIRLVEGQPIINPSLPESYLNLSLPISEIPSQDDNFS